MNERLAHLGGKIKMKCLTFKEDTAKKKETFVWQLGSLSTRVFETRTAIGRELFSLITCLHTTTFTLLSIFSPFEMISINWIWDTALPWHAKCSPVAVCVLKSSLIIFTSAYVCFPSLSNKLFTLNSLLYGRCLFKNIAFVIQMCQTQEQKTLYFYNQWDSGWYIMQQTTSTISSLFKL